MSDRQKYVVGSDVLYFDPERSTYVGTRSVSLFFCTKKGEISQMLADKAAEHIVAVQKVTVTERQVSLFCPRVKSIADAQRLAERFAELLETERHNRAQARQRSAKGTSRSQMTVK